MDFDALVAAIVSRVAEKLEQENCDKPKLLILTQEHGDVCHTMLESPRIGAHYRTECALLSDYQVRMEDYAGILLFNLTNDALVRIATGVCGTPYTELVSKALLLGKPVWLPHEQVELFKYEATAAPMYYGMLRKRLTLLEQSGVVLCAQDELEDKVLAGCPAPAASPIQETCGTCNACEACKPVEPVAEPVAEPAEPLSGAANVMAQPVRKELTLGKRVITERDITEAVTNGVTVVHVGARAILTDLAKEYAHNQKLEIVRD
jgi:ethanolamine utilization protein